MSNISLINNTTVIFQHYYYCCILNSSSIHKNIVVNSLKMGSPTIVKHQYIIDNTKIYRKIKKTNVSTMKAIINSWNIRIIK